MSEDARVEQLVREHAQKFCDHYGMDAYRGSIEGRFNEAIRAALAAACPQGSVAGAAGILADVRAFHEACDVPVLPAPTIPSPARVQLRRDILREEWEETDDALVTNDLVQIADGLADIIYVAVGTAIEYGIPLDRVWAEVQRSNMAKRDPATGKVRRREDGKILKPNGWTPPDIAAALSAAPTPGAGAGEGENTQIGPEGKERGRQRSTAETHPPGNAPSAPETCPVCRGMKKQGKWVADRVYHEWDCPACTGRTASAPPAASGEVEPSSWERDKWPIEERVKHLELYGTANVDSWLDIILKRLDTLEAALRSPATERATIERAVHTIEEWTKPSVLKLAAGEMTAQELRTVIAVLNGVAARVRALAATKEG